MGLLQLLDGISGGGGTRGGTRGGFKSRERKLDPVYEQLSDDVRIAHVQDTSPRGRAAAATQRAIYGGDGNGFADANRRPIIEVRHPETGAFVPINPGKAAIGPGEQGVLLEQYLQGQYDPFKEVGIVQQSRDVLNAAGNQLTGSNRDGSAPSRLANKKADSTAAAYATKGGETFEEPSQTTETGNSVENAPDDIDSLISSLRKKLGPDFAPKLAEIMTGS